MIINNFKVVNVSVFLHGAKESEDYLGAWAEQNLPFSPLFCVYYVFQGVCQGTHPNHF
jgi:hypothetical protein